MKLSRPLLILIGGMVCIVAVKQIFFHHAVMTATMQINIIAAASALGFALGWFTSPKADVFRLYIILGLVLLLAALALGDGSYFGWMATGFFSVVAFSAGLFYWVGQAVKAFAQKPTTFGSAEWADMAYLEENGLIGTDGIRIGEFAEGGKTVPLHYSGTRHLLTVAPTTSGKGTTAIIPNLLTYTGSMLVVDPKGENAMITAKHRYDMGQDIFIVDPWQITGYRGAHFNPLDWLIASDIDITENAMLLADALIIPEDSSDKFWIEEAKALLQGLILYVATDKAEHQNRTLARVRDLLLLDGDLLKLLFQRMLDSDHHIVASTGARCLQKDDKLLSNVIASAQSQTHFLDSERLRDSMVKSDFKFEDLKVRPMTVYLVLPADRLKTFSRWLRLTIQQALTVCARNIEVKPERPVIFLLDELTSLGNLSMVEQAYSLMAGFGMQLWGIVQDLGRLKKVYGEGAYESFISNSGMISYFGSRDKFTTEYFSSLCGVTTVWSFTTAVSNVISSSFSQSGSSSSNSQSTTNTTAPVQRKLAFPDELMRVPTSRQLLLIDNHHPIVGQKTPWFLDPELKSLGRNLHEA